MTRKNYLLVGASALALAFFAAPASAFDEVNWEWNLVVNERIVKDVNIDIDITPTGLVLLENLQIFIGDVNAYSLVYDIYNNQPAGGDGDATVDLGEIDLFFVYDDNGFLVPATDTCTPDTIDTCDIIDATVFVNEQPGDGTAGNITLSVDLDGYTVALVPGDAFDALTELPEVVSAATAVANNSSITSSVAVEMHEGQFAFDTCGDCAGNTNLDGVAYATGNTHTNLALALTYAAAAGFISPADITATSWVFNILNATVDSTATAVANNKSITIEAATPSDALLMADITQFAYANVSAYSQVNNVSVNNYTNLGVLGRPLVNSVATAVGNNLNITVGPVAP